MSKTKLVPRAATSMPRAELNAALEASDLAKFLSRELFAPMSVFHMYSDSRVVLGYICNNEKRFTNYVTNRVFSILKVTSSSQWSYVPTDLNPADIACRPCDVGMLISSVWLTGPEFLWSTHIGIDHDLDFSHPLPEEKTLSTTAETMPMQLVSDSNKPFIHMINVTRFVLKVVRTIDKVRQNLGQITVIRQPQVTSEDAENFLIRQAQGSEFADVLKSTAKTNRLSSLDPFLDQNGVLRVAGRLKDSHLPYAQKYPVILPKNHALTTIIIRHVHEKIKHQGRHITSGALRQAGYHIHKGTKVLKTFIEKFIVCRKLRAVPMEQKMSTLPSFRLDASPPFTHCGLDVFGPFAITEGKSTRQSKGSKMWGLLLTCMASRAVHVEQLYGLDTYSLMNALSRFMSVRGTVKHFYCDRGTNFVSAQKETNSDVSFDGISRDLQKRGVSWHFNPAHSSHHGGVWERKIGSIRRILEACLLHVKDHLPTRDELSTFFCEASNIVNNTPMWTISGDPKDPLPLSPAMLTTLKEDTNPPPLESFSPTEIVLRKKPMEKVPVLSTVLLGSVEEILPSRIARKKKVVYSQKESICRRCCAS